MPRRYADLNDLIHDLDDRDLMSDDPYGLPALDDEDLALLTRRSPDETPADAPPPTPKRGRPRKKAK